MKVCLFIASIFLLAGTAIAAPKPNIVHIMVDDLGWQDIAAHKIGGGMRCTKLLTSTA